MALKLCHNREKILALALRNQGVIGNDSHVAPVQPEYAEVAPRYRSTAAKSKQLLAAAGYTSPLNVELTVPSDWPESMAYAQALKEDALAGGFNITLKTMPATQYWGRLDRFQHGHHLVVAPGARRHAARRGVHGRCERQAGPVERESLGGCRVQPRCLAKADGTLDIAKRKEIMAQIETIMRDRGAVCTPFFMNVWQIYNKNIKGVIPSPEEYVILHEAWKDPAANSSYDQRSRHPAAGVSPAAGTVRIMCDGESLMIATHGTSMTTAHYARMGKQECQGIHLASLEILTRIGLDVHDDKARALLVKGGAQADGLRVRVPEYMVTRALSTVPKRLTLYNRSGKPAIRAGGYDTYYGGGSDCLNILDHHTGERRKPVLQDVGRGVDAHGRPPRDRFRHVPISTRRRGPAHL